MENNNNLRDPLLGLVTYELTVGKKVNVLFKNANLYHCFGIILYQFLIEIGFIFMTFYFQLSKVLIQNPIFYSINLVFLLILLIVPFLFASCIKKEQNKYNYMTLLGFSIACFSVNGTSTCPLIDEAFLISLLISLISTFSIYKILSDKLIFFYFGMVAVFYSFFMIIVILFLFDRIPLFFTLLIIGLILLLSKYIIKFIKFEHKYKEDECIILSINLFNVFLTIKDLIHLIIII